MSRRFSRGRTRNASARFERLEWSSAAVAKVSVSTLMGRRNHAGHADSSWRRSPAKHKHACGADLSPSANPADVSVDRRPVNEIAAPDDVVLRHGPPEPAVRTAVTVV